MTIFEMCMISEESNERTLLKCKYNSLWSDVKQWIGALGLKQFKSSDTNEILKINIPQIR